MTPAIKKSVITRFESNEKFMNLLQYNQGIIILKIGASWCKPCHQIKPVVDAFFASSPPNVVCADIDIVDKSNEELYLTLKRQLRLQGIPCLLMYRAETKSFTPDEMITGTDPAKLHYFFKRCGQHLKAIMDKQPTIPEQNA